MSDFKVNHRDGEGFSVLELKGYLDAHTAPDLETTFQKLLTDKKYNIIVNCKDLTYISSAGLGVFMAYIEDVRKNRGDIKLTNMSPKVYNVFDLLGFPVLYEIYRDEHEAANKFRQQSKKG
ncbi:MAG: STAS domain-containing protein [Ignavibacteriales bacterium]|nr:STAS domain-containing protein [Ignavibacteriales bacterium]